MAASTFQNKITVVFAATLHLFKTNFGWPLLAAFEENMTLTTDEFEWVKRTVHTPDDLQRVAVSHPQSVEQER